MMMFASFKVVLFCSVLGLVVAQSVTHYIVPSTNQPCPSDSCLTLSQFCANPNGFLQRNTTLIFQPGNYTIDRDFAITEIQTFSMIIDDSSRAESKVEITCNGYASMSFSAVDHVYISGLNFEYIGLDVSSVGEFAVRYCDFARYTQSAMQFYNSNVSITSTLFTLNSVGSYYGRVRLVGPTVYLVVGGALAISSSNVSVVNSTFDRNSAGAGGAIFASQRSNIVIINTNFRENSVRGRYCLGGVMYAEVTCSVSIDNCTFGGNEAVGNGGVFTVTGSTLTIGSSEFINNSAERGAVIYAKDSNIIRIEDSLFINNSASISGGVITEVRAEVRISNCTFSGNKAGTYAGVIDAFFYPVYINESRFMNNSAVKYGGVFVASYADINVNYSEFSNNTGRRAGVLYAFGKAGAIFENCTLLYNKARLEGGVLFAHDSTINIVASKFGHNNAYSGGVAYIQSNTVLNVNEMTVENNTAKQGVLYCIESIANFSNRVRMIGNQGSLFLYYSKMYFKGRMVVASNTAERRSELTRSLHSEGGAITAFQSEIYFHKNSHSFFRYNRADSGGAVLTRASKLFVSGILRVLTNTARVSGGGIYLYQSELNCKGASRLVLYENSALERGGGIHAVSSIVSVEYNYDRHKDSYSGSVIWFQNNTAGSAGGGICLEVNAKVNVLNVNEYDSEKPLYALQFIENSAYYGGAVYVADNTNSVLCASSLNNSLSTTTECFLQALVIVIRIEGSDEPANNTLGLSANLFNTLFQRNHAHSRGATLYGGLLDRCTLSPFVKGSVEMYDSEKKRNTTVDGVAYFKSMSVITDNDFLSISSDPVQVCFCRDGLPDCSYRPQPIKVKKGGNFTVELVAADQVENPVAAVIHCTPKSNLSGLAEGQIFQSISNACSNLSFNVFSPNHNEELVLYADGPCKDAELSQRQVEIKFEPCTCSTGFQPVVSIDTRCVCECDSQLTNFISDLSCDPQTNTLDRRSNFWIAHFNGSDFARAGYLFHAHCPFDYCLSSSSMVKINLNKKNGPDKQCANNRHDLLCGACKPGFSLSLGSSNCVVCPTYWPALVVLFLLAAIIAGIGLVAMILILNMTVAVGTLNGIILYANIVAASSGTFFPSSKPTFASVFIAWLNLDFGIEACFYKGMNAYWKTWLELCFPLYVIFLVIVITVVGEKSKRFSNLIGKKNPVASLATLILFSYAKLLHIVVTVLSSTVLWYPNGKPRTVWLVDATVEYFKGGHIALSSSR